VSKDKKDVLDMALQEQLSKEEYEEVTKFFNIDSPEGVQQQAGIFKAFGFASDLFRFMQIRQLQILKQGKRYKLLGLKDFNELCQKVGIPRRTADRYLKHMESFGNDVYKGMVQIGFNQSDLNILTKADVDVEMEGEQPVIEIEGEKIPITSNNRNEILEAVTRLVKEKETADKQKADTDAKNRELKKKNEQLTREVEDLRLGIPAELREFQMDLGQMQMRLIAIGEKLQAMSKDISVESDPRLDALYQAVAWIDRWSMDQHARIMGDEPPSEENFFQTSYQNAENLEN
jgi:hypothetical protein